MGVAGLTCQMKSRGALLSRTEGRKRAMWNVGSASDTRFRLTRLHTGASGTTCSHSRPRPQPASSVHPARHICIVLQLTSDCIKSRGSPQSFRIRRY